MNSMNDLGHNHAALTSAGHLPAWLQVGVSGAGTDTARLYDRVWHQRLGIAARAAIVHASVAETSIVLGAKRVHHLHAMDAPALLGYYHPHYWADTDVPVRQEWLRVRRIPDWSTVRYDE